MSENNHDIARKHIIGHKMFLDDSVIAHNSKQIKIVSKWDFSNYPLVGSDLNITTTDVPEGTNLYYTQARFDSAFSGKTTDDLTEGTTNKYYSSTLFDNDFASKTTDDLSEGTSNFYYTNAKVDNRVQASDYTITGTWTFNNAVTGQTPTATTHLATKGYVDSIAQGLDWQDSVLDEVDFTTSEPSSPSVGDRYVNTTTGTSSITGQSVTKDYIYEWNGSSWDETAPNEGFAVWIEDLNKLKVYNGSSWVSFGSTIDHNVLYDLQGGTANEYYHLTQSAYNYLSNQDQSVLTTSSPTFADMTLTGDLTVGGNEIYSSSAKVMTFSGSSVWFAGDIQVVGNDIYDSGGNTAITFSGTGNTQINGDLTANSNTIYVSGGGQDYWIEFNNSGYIGYITSASDDGVWIKNKVSGKTIKLLDTGTLNIDSSTTINGDLTVSGSFKSTGGTTPVLDITGATDPTIVRIDDYGATLWRCTQYDNANHQGQLIRQAYDSNVGDYLGFRAGGNGDNNLEFLVGQDSIQINPVDSIDSPVFSISSTGNVDITGDLTVSGTGTSSFAGLIEITTDTDEFLRVKEDGWKYISFKKADGTRSAYIGVDSSENVVIASDTAGSGTGTTNIVSQHNIILKTDYLQFRNSSNTVVGTIDSSGNLQIDGDLTVSGGYLSFSNWNFAEITSTMAAITDEDTGGAEFAVYSDGVDYANAYAMIGSNVKINSGGNSYLNGGNVGIGTSNPSKKLEVAGSITAKSSDYIDISADQTDSAKIAMGVTSGTGEGFINVVGNGDYAGLGELKFLIEGSEKVRIDNNGNVGIGTSNPSYKLDVQGTGRFTDDVTLSGTAPTIYLTGTSQGQWAYIRLHNGATYYDIATKSDDDSGSLQFRPSGSSTYRMTLSSTGNLKITGDLTVSGGDISLGGTTSVAKRERNSATITTPGWYRIASNGPVSDGGSGGTRAAARFVVWDTTSSRHSYTVFYATVHYGSNPTITLLNRGYYNTNGVIKKIRIVEGDTYEGAAVEVYVDNGDTSCGVAYAIYDNDQSSGWTPVDWTAGEVPSGFSTTVLNLDTYDPVLAIASGSGQSDTFYVKRNGDMKLTGDLTVSGTGDSSFAGNVGIGTSNPSSRFSIVTDAGGASTWDDAGILIKNTGSTLGETAVAFQLGSDSNYWFIGQNQLENRFTIAYGTDFTDANTQLTIQNKNLYVGGTASGYSGTLYAGGIILTAKTRYYSLAPSDFTTRYPDADDVTHLPYYVEVTTGTSIQFSAPVHLPHGAVVTEVKIYGSDSSDSWTMYRNDRDGGGVTMASADMNSADTSISYATIDNSLYSYSIWTGSIASSSRIYGGYIKYTITNPYP